MVWFMFVFDTSERANAVAAIIVPPRRFGKSGGAVSLLRLAFPGRFWQKLSARSRDPRLLDSWLAFYVFLDYGCVAEVGCGHLGQPGVFTAELSSVNQRAGKSGMKKRNLLSFGLRTVADANYPRVRCAAGVAALVCLLAAVPALLASENVPHRLFAQGADIPAPGQFVVGLVYEESESYHIFVKGESRNITTRAAGENYGIDINQGYLALQYGITERWAADLNVGATSAGWRSFDNGVIQSTTGLMDISFGFRYQVFNEATAGSPWLPTLTLRAGAVLPGSYNENFQFAPGVRSAAIEPELLARKHFGWTGLGAFTDLLYRWNRTTGNDQYIAAIGLFQQIKGWELDVGYRHLQTINGSDIVYPVDPASNGGFNIMYPRDVREISDAIEAGFSYTTSKRKIRYGFHSLTVVDGNNTDRKFWVGGSVDIPFGGKQAQ